MGYEFYLNAIKDKQNPEHQVMQQWVKEQGDRGLPQKQINMRLKKSLGQYMYWH